MNYEASQGTEPHVPPTQCAESRRAQRRLEQLRQPVGRRSFVQGGLAVGGLFAVSQWSAQPSAVESPANTVTGIFQPRQTVPAGPSIAAAPASVPPSGPTTDGILVVINLRGGFDGLNAVAPVGDPAYAKARGKIAVPRKAALSLDNTFGLHPAMAGLHTLWKANQMSIIHSVGSLGDHGRSHFECMARLERGTADLTAGGWMDRLVRALAGQPGMVGAQLGGNSVTGAFNGTSPKLTAPGLKDVRMIGPHPKHSSQARWMAALQAMYSGQPERLAVGSAAAAATLDLATKVRKADPAKGDPEAKKGGATPESRGYPKRLGGHHLNSSLMDIARLVKSGSGLRVAATEMAQWDMHSAIGTATQENGWQHRQLKYLSDCIAAFANDLGPELWAKTTVVTVSEFGRRVAANASMGLDHGRGNMMFVCGGGIHGGKMLGDWKGLAADQLHRGDLPATVEYRQVIGEILRARMGVADVGSVFPQVVDKPIGLV